MMALRTVIVLAFSVVALLGVWVFMPRTPYFSPYTDWMTYNGQEYRLEGWFSNTPLASDYVRFVLRHRNGGLSAVSQLGYSPVTVDCTTLGKCIVAFYPGRHHRYPGGFEPDLKKMISIPDPKKDAPRGGPAEWEGREEGFAYSTAEEFLTLRSDAFYSFNDHYDTYINFNLFAPLSVWLALCAYRACRKHAPEQPEKRGLFIAGCLMGPYICLLLMLASRPVITHAALVKGIGLTTLLWLPFCAASLYLYRRSLQRPASERAEFINRRIDWLWVACVLATGFAVAKVWPPL